MNINVMFLLGKIRIIFMAYDNRKLIWGLKQKGYLKSRELEKALITFPREKFVPSNVRQFAYIEAALLEA